MPAVGASSVVSILMVVVLPAPLGPRKAKISPALTSKEMPIDRGDLAEFLDQVFDVNHRRVDLQSRKY